MTALAPRTDDLTDFQDELEEYAAQAAAEHENQAADAWARRLRRRVAAIGVTVVLAVAGFIGYRAYEQHLAEAAAAEAAHARVVAAAEQERLDDAFYAGRAALANTAGVEAWQAEHEARETAAVETIEADLDAAREVLAASKNRVLDNQVRVDLKNAIRDRDSLLTGGASLAVLEAAAADPVDTTPVTEAVEAWEAEQARIAAEKAERERQARLAAQQQATTTTNSGTSTAGSGSAPASSTGGLNAVERVAQRWGYEVRYYIPKGATGNGAYWEDTPGVFYVRPGHEWRTGLANHEIAHGIIHQQCGTVNPTIAGGRGEQVAEAYAQLYMGGGSTGNGGTYVVTDSDIAIAKLIHAGVCK